MKIEIVCRDGSPLHVSERSIFGEDGRFGVGGAELALLTLCKGWHDKGYEVILYNDPDDPNGSCFEQRPINAFAPVAKRDVVIFFRSPSPHLVVENLRGMRCWWSCDQFTIDNYQRFSTMVDKVVTISPHHSQYFRDVYGILDTTTIDLPVRIWEYEPIDVWPEKVPNKCIFNSIPDRGAMELAQVWSRIVSRFPNAHLTITSDWRLWDKHVPSEYVAPYRAAFASLPNVQYLGAINRRELIKHEKEAQIHINPNIYEELFMISVAETQVAGAYPVSSTTGAIRTTNMGHAIEGSPRDAPWQEECANVVVELLENPDRLQRLQNKVQHDALHRFSLENILKQWEEKVFC